MCAVGSPDRAQARVGEPICINYYCSRRSSLAGIATKFTGNRVSSETSQETSVGMARPMAPFTMFGKHKEYLIPVWTLYVMKVRKAAYLINTVFDLCNKNCVVLLPAKLFL